MGMKDINGEVLFFDVTSAGIRPRFYDVHGLIVDHGEPYEIGDVTPVLREFFENYSRDLEWKDFQREVALTEGLVALRQIGRHMKLLEQRRGEAWQDENEARLGHIKWLRLSINRAREVLVDWLSNRGVCASV